MNVTYDLDDAQGLFLQQPPVSASTPVDDDDGKENSGHGDLHTPPLSSPVNPDTALTFAQWEVLQRAGLTPGRIPVKAPRGPASSAKRRRLRLDSAADPPTPADREALQRAVLTPGRVPVRASRGPATVVHVDSPEVTAEALRRAGLTPGRVRLRDRTALTPARVDSPEVTAEALQRAGLTPGRVPVRGRTALTSAGVDSPELTAEALRRAGLTPGRVRLRDRTALTSARLESHAPMAPSSPITAEALQRAGLTPGRVLVRGRGAPAEGRVSSAERLRRAGLVPQRGPVRPSGDLAVQHRLRSDVETAGAPGARRTTGRGRWTAEAEDDRRQTWAPGAEPDPARPAALRGSTAPSRDLLLPRRSTVAGHTALPTERRINFEDEAAD